MAGKPTGARRLGIYGFGAAAQIVAQVARWQGWQVHAFTRAGDLAGQQQARQLGAVWAGGSDERPPGDPLEAAIIFAPVGPLVPAALRAVAKGGRVVCGGIHMSDIPGFPYEELWGERCICSVANLTRNDAREFLALAPQVPVRVQPQIFPMHEANQALDALRARHPHRARRARAALVTRRRARRTFSSTCICHRPSAHRGQSTHNHAACAPNNLLPGILDVATILP